MEKHIQTHHQKNSAIDPSGKNEEGNKLPQYIAGLSATIGALAAGMVYGWTSPAGPDGEYLSKEYNINITPSEFSWIGSLFNLGAAAICVPIGILTDVIGRKGAMLILIIPFTIGWALIIWSTSVVMFNTGRFILGISGGAFCVTAPMYTAEIAEVSIRGGLGSYYELMLCIGIVVAYILGAAVSMFTLSLISASVPLIFFIIFCFMPESPMYYLQKGNIEAARVAYKRLRGSKYNVEAELKAQIQTLAEDQRNKVSFFVAIRSNAALKGLFIAYGLMFFQQFSGINAVIFYASSIFQTSRNTIDPNTSIILVGILQAFTVFISILVIDRLGRRVLLMISAGAMCLSLFVLGIYFFFKSQGHNVDAIDWLPLTCICVYITLISIGFGAIPWMMMGELFAPQIKGVAGSSACLFNWLMSFVVTKFFSDVENKFGAAVTFWIFAAICGLAVVFVFFIVPETKGKTLEQIQKELGD